MLDSECDILSLEDSESDIVSRSMEQVGSDDTYGWDCFSDASDTERFPLEDVVSNVNFDVVAVPSFEVGEADEGTISLMAVIGEFLVD